MKIGGIRKEVLVDSGSAGNLISQDELKNLQSQGLNIRFSHCEVCASKPLCLMPDCFPIGLVNLQNGYKQIACCLFDQSQEFLFAIFIALNN